MSTTVTHRLVWGLLVAAMALASPATAAGDYSFVNSWGSMGGPAELAAPNAIAVAPNGTMYTNDGWGHVVILNSSGAITGRLGADGDFDSTDAIAVDPSSAEVYVADSGRGRIDVFSSGGTLLRSFGADAGASRMQWTGGIAIGPTGDVYVADTGNSRVVMFHADGTFVREWGSEGSYNGQFEYPLALAVDGAGNVYVADTDNHRIQVFDSSGTFLRGWGSGGSGDGQFTRPRGIAIDRANATVYVADTNNNRVETFTLDGTFLSKFGGPGSGDGQFNLPYGITLDASAGVLVTDWLHGRIEKFHNGTFVSSFAVAQGSGSGLFNGPSGASIGPDGNVYVVDTGNQRVQVFGSNGSWLRQWGTPGWGNGQFSYPYGIAVAADGTVYVANSANYRIDAFSPGGAFLRSIGSSGSGDGQVSYPQGVAVDWNTGHVFVADTGNNRVEEFLPDGTYWRGWGSPGTADGQFDSPQAIAVDAAHNVYVADTGNGRVQMFQTGGAFVRKWSVSYPTGLATLPGGGVLASSTWSIRLLNLNGTVSVPRFVGGSYFNGLRGIAADLQGYVYTTESNGNRVQRFGPLPTAPGTPAGNPAIARDAFSLSWSAASAAGGGSLTYTLQHRDANDPGYTQVAAGLTGLSYAFTAAAREAEGTWTYRVCASNDVGAGPCSASVTVKVDRTAPAAPGIVLDRAPDWSGSIDWFGDQVTASFSPGADPGLPDGSAGAGVDPASLPAAPTFTTSGEHQIAAADTDRAGNVSVVATRTVGVDAAAPTVTLTAPASVPQGAAVSATWTAADTGGSGLSGPASGTVLLDTSTPGANTATVSVSDHVGHKTTATAAYTVTATAPAATAPAAPPNVLKMVTLKRMQPSATGKVTLKLSCLGSRPGGCTATLSLKSAGKIPTRYLGRGKPRVVTFANGRFTIATGATTTVTLRISKANLALLQRMKTARALLQASADPTVISRTISLVAPRPSGHR